MLNLANAHTDDYRTEAVSLLAKIVPKLGKEVTTNAVLPVYLNSCSDDLFHVRKVSEQHAPDFAKVIGVEATENKILPAFAILGTLLKKYYKIRKVVLRQVKASNKLIDFKFLVP